MSLDDLKKIDVKHLDEAPHYLLIGLGVLLLGIVLVVLGVLW